MTILITICLFCRRRKSSDGSWVHEDPIWAKQRTELVSHVTCPDCIAVGRRMDEQEREG